MRTSETRCFGGVLLICSKTTGCVAVQAVCVFCYLSSIYTDAWAADYKTQITHKKPYSVTLTTASIAASKEFKTAACRADLMCCCVLLPESQLLLQKICCVIFAWLRDLGCW
jgi:hypothetical protein